MSIHPALLRPASFLPDEPVCLQVVSRNLEGELARPSGEPERCPDVDCFTLPTSQRFAMETQTHEPCDEKAAGVLDTKISGKLFHIFAGSSGEGRAAHSASIWWSLPGGHGRGVGTMRGITNAGTHRAPVFRGCEDCDAPTMQGVLEASVTIGAATRPASAPRVVLLRAVYKLRVDPSERGLAGRFTGTLEGVVMFDCDL